MKSILSDEQLSKLKFIKNQAYVCPKRLAVIVGHVVNKDSYDRIVSLLNGRDTMNGIVKGKKAYVLPEVTTSVNVYKNFLRKNGYGVTTNPKNADFIVGSGELESIGAVKEFYIAHFFDGIEVLDECNENLLPYFIDYTGIVSPENYESIFDRHNLSYKAATLYNECDSSNAYVVRDNIMEVVYWILANKLPVVNCDTLFDSFDKVIIDQEMYETLKQMIRSGKEDLELATEILSNCNLNKSAYYLSKLTGHRYSFLHETGRTKIGMRLFDYLCELNNIRNSDLLNLLYKEDALTEDIFNSIIEDEMSEHHYTKTVSVLLTIDPKPKYSYQEFILEKSNIE
jgi:hypothetical protein